MKKIDMDIFDIKERVLSLSEASTKEPLIHSHVSDSIPEDHPLAYEDIFCIKCNDMVHAFNNECMKTWIECTAYNLEPYDDSWKEKGCKVYNYCFECYSYIVLT